MAEEVKKNVNENKGDDLSWRSIQITTDYPLNVIIQYINTINSRLCTIEDNITVPRDNRMITLTDLYVEQARAEREKEQAKTNIKTEEDK